MVVLLLRYTIKVQKKKLIVTHHAPDPDAIAAVWLLKNFDSQHYADARVAFVNPGEKIDLEEAEKYQAQLHEITFVDTGHGEFDHHQPSRAKKKICASSLVFDYICKLHPERKEDKALQELVAFINDLDHFGEIYWPEPTHTRYVFMLHELIRGHEYTDPHNDDSQMHFGLKCLDYAYAALKKSIRAAEAIEQKGIEFDIQGGKALAIETRNDDAIKRAQKMGFLLVISKDSKQGNIRIKARPDAKFNLDKLYQAIKKIDHKGTWFYHGGGKMLLNGSRKKRNHLASPLTLEETMKLVKEHYA